MTAVRQVDQVGFSYKTIFSLLIGPIIATTDNPSFWKVDDDFCLSQNLYPDVEEQLHGPAAIVTEEHSRLRFQKHDTETTFYNMSNVLSAFFNDNSLNREPFLAEPSSKPKCESVHIREGKNSRYCVFHGDLLLATFGSSEAAQEYAQRVFATVSNS